MSEQILNNDVSTAESRAASGQVPVAAAGKTQKLRKAQADGKAESKRKKAAERKMPGDRKTQAERREQTRAKVLASACRIFAEKGYADTSLKDIADELGLTITPIYHYFGNKQSLFLAVTEAKEAELAERIEAFSSQSLDLDVIEIWDMLINMTQQPEFVRIVLTDAPSILGRDRWEDTSVVRAVSKVFRERLLHWLGGDAAMAQFSENDLALLQRMWMGCFAEAALMLAANPDYDSRPLIKKILNFFTGA
jgi:AcrR family transcriptional regulator